MASYTIEPICSKDLYKIARKIDSSTNDTLLKNIIEFTSKCLTGVKSVCRDVSLNLSGNFRNKKQKKQTLQGLFKDLSNEKDYKKILDLCEFLECELLDKKPTKKRWQLWNDFKKALRLSFLESYRLEEACWKVKNQEKYCENRVPSKCISRTVLLKGLECDCAVVIDEGLDLKNFYVAITRGAKELHIFSESPCYPSHPLPFCSLCNARMSWKQNNKTKKYFLGCSNYNSKKCKGSCSIEKFFLDL
ncbi:MAG: ATP-binding domain-containing protein [Lentisphaerae bacterium]|nr:ATP-binding domain-containing protein [Lentisphaerota bacterium]MCP4100081.1 ATP-binding domain-containing protein [Lentisphaerota bacterium]